MTEQSISASGFPQEIEKYYGKYPGLVLENEPPESGAHRGELLVEISGLLEETPDGKGERPIQVRARPCFLPGFFFVPEVGAQVWIEFVAGDINSPLWTGVWYPKEMTPKTFDDQESTEFQKIIRTASGHVIQMDDAEDEEKVVVRHKADTIITLDNDNLDITHHSGTSLIIDKDGNVKIEHKDKMIIEMKESSVTVKADDIVLDGVVEITGETTIKGETTIDKKTTIKDDLEVGKGPKTTISNNEIKGG